MIRMPRKYLTGAVQLFRQHHAGQHVGPGLDAKREQHVRAGSYSITVPVGPADDKGDARLAVILKGLDFLCKILTAQCLAAFIEDENEIGLVQPLQYRGLGGFAIIDFMQRDLPVAHAGHIIVIKLVKRAAFQAADGDDFKLRHVLYQTGRAADWPSGSVCNARHIFSML